jgi:hypothetical protein
MRPLISADARSRGGADMPQTNITDLTYEEIFDIMFVYGGHGALPDTEEVMLSVSRESRKVFVILRSGDRAVMLNVGFEYATDETAVIEALRRWASYRPVNCLQGPEAPQHDLWLPESIDCDMIKKIIDDVTRFWEEESLNALAAALIDPDRCDWHLGTGG